MSEVPRSISVDTAGINSHSAWKTNPHLFIQYARHTTHTQHARQIDMSGSAFSYGLRRSLAADSATQRERERESCVCSSMWKKSHQKTAEVMSVLTAGSGFKCNALNSLFDKHIVHQLRTCKKKVICSDMFN